jgi:hypothetical protein
MRLQLILLFLLICYLTDSAIAQKTTFNYYLVEGGLVYQPPAKYSELDYHGNFFPDSNSTFILSMMFYSVKNNKDDIVIGFAPIPIYKIDKESLTYKLFPSDPNKNWEIKVKVESDTSDNKPVYYNKKQLAVINADNAVLYQLKMTRIFLKKYTLCKVVVIHKENVSDAQIFYFYNNTSKDLVDKQIKVTSNILKFKADSLQAK